MRNDSDLDGFGDTRPAPDPIPAAAHEVVTRALDLTDREEALSLITKALRLTYTAGQASAMAQAIALGKAAGL